MVKILPLSRTPRVSFRWGEWFTPKGIRSRQEREEKNRQESKAILTRIYGLGKKDAVNNRTAVHAQDGTRHGIHTEAAVTLLKKLEEKIRENEEHRIASLTNHENALRTYGQSHSGDPELVPKPQGGHVKIDYAKPGLVKMWAQLLWAAKAKSAQKTKAA